MSDPAARKDRACNNVAQDVFFPSAQQPKAVARAQGICARCPVLAECAAWAAPLVARKDLEDCVIAAVHVPPRRKSFDEFEKTAAVLRGISRRISATRTHDFTKGAA
ncbi:WhiB family transcriptional regulator [Nocardia jinanensis]|uniref:4Fe-4S Wbl-type domain-containing protein n=1 Tax=Nocardia jinanensis TaxID=382504 RepID=A0A917RY08_9NOCA|nr:WhiB family transcriptional regulator [Nocardia jinanensis]GGL44235.1 hypothetical protein GCM10011588_68690 [Nocardia jinanensis]